MREGEKHLSERENTTMLFSIFTFSYFDTCHMSMSYWLGISFEKSKQGKEK